MSVTILVGDVLDKLPSLEDESVHCVVTSPPYWGLRDYGTAMWEGGDPECKHRRPGPKDRSAAQPKGGHRDGFRHGKGDTDHANEPYKDTCHKCGAHRVDNQIGLEPTVEAYVEKMVAVFAEVRRVLRTDGTLWLNMGDCYTGANNTNRGGNANWGSQPGREVQVGRDKKVDGLKPKDLVGQPWRLAFALQADGWWLRSDIIWAKPNPMPESCSDRPTKAHEYVFMLTKSGAHTYWTHRDHAFGTQKSPKADYRWVDQAAEYLYEHRTDVSGKRIAATFKALGFSANFSKLEAVIEFAEEPEGWKTEPFPKIPKGWPPCARKKRWRRTNLWRGHDYFWDQEAVRSPLASSSVSRMKQASFETQTGGPKDYGHRTNTNRSARKALCNLREKMIAAEKWGDRHAGDAKRAGVGANMRSIWTIPTQPFPKAHFATFPEELPRRCIAAGTSEKGCCPKCGAPWVRVVEKSGGTTGKSWHDHNSDGAKGQRCTNKAGNGMSIGDSADADGQSYTTKTTGWKRGCKHKGKPIACTVLDLFSGAGTTGLVAVRMGRNYIGIELNPDYAEMSEKRIRGKLPLMIGD